VTKHMSAELMNARDQSNRRLSAPGSSGAIDLTMLCAWQWKNAAIQPSALEYLRALALGAAAGADEYRWGNRR
jgi:hypothetical protein